MRWNHRASLVSRRSLAALGAGLVTLLLVQPASARSDAKFVSTQYGYSLVLPGASSRWNARLALVPWTTGPLNPGSLAFDSFTDLRTARQYTIAARSRPRGSTLASWAKLALTGICAGEKPAKLRSSTLSGTPALVFRWSCADANAIGIVALHARKGYLLVAAAPPTFARSSLEPAFEGVRKSFRFRH